MKYAVLVPDGAADRPLAALGGKTPLQAAHTPNLDALARNGRCGLLRTIPDGMPAGSEVANLSIMGYDPRRHYAGRGVLEAASMGVDLAPDDVALRCNTICEAGGKIKNHSAGHISSEESARLIASIAAGLGGPRVVFHPGVGYRHLLVLKGGFPPDVRCMPPHDHLAEPLPSLLPAAESPAAEETAALLRRLIADSRAILAEHPVNAARVAAGKDPANLIWPWSPGRRPSMETYRKRFGIEGAVISAVDLVRGLGVLAGFEVVRVPGATGLSDTDYEGKADAALGALARRDFVYVHVEAPDEAGHDGDTQLKVRCIEDFDRRLLGRFLAGIDRSSTAVAVMPDHATPLAVRGHTSEPVPFVVAGPRIEPDAVAAFDEERCAAGAFGLVEGSRFIDILLAPAA